MRTCETDVSLGKHIITLLFDIPFFAEVSRNVKKFPTRDTETACIMYDVDQDEVQLAWNPDFFETLTPNEIIGVIVHEFHHLVDGHITVRSKDFPEHERANWAMDLAINSLIIDYKNMALPKCALVPGRDVPWVEGALKEFLKSLPTKKATDFYYEKLKSKVKEPQSKSGQQQQDDSSGAKGEKQQGEGDCKEKGNPGNEGDGSGNDDKKSGEKGQPDDNATSGSGGTKPDKNGKPTAGGTLDDHSSWGEINSDIRERIEAQIDNIVEKAAQVADSSSNGWGNMPADVIQNIRRRISKQVDWRTVLKQFVGALLVGGRKSSRRHINRKQPYDYPGVKRGRTVKLLVALDESASVDDKMLEEFFAEIYSLNRLLEVDILPFDCVADEKMIVPLRKGSGVELKRKKRGGTCFDAPSDIFNDTKNRDKWDALLIVTDGQAPKPKNVRKRRGWVIPEGCKLHFETDETVIVIKKKVV